MRQRSAFEDISGESTREMNPRGPRSDTGAVTVTEPIRHSSTRARVVAVHDGIRSERTDSLATEEPLEIRVQGPGQDALQVAVTMRTPGDDFELAAGFLPRRGHILRRHEDVIDIAYCTDEARGAALHRGLGHARSTFDPHASTGTSTRRHLWRLRQSSAR